MRQRAKVDANQREIVAALRQMGASVQHLHMVGHGCPDLLVGKDGVNYLLECKDGTLPKSRQRLSAAEMEFHECWRGTAWIVASVDAALAVLRGKP